jgi:hypothetical protein
MPKINLDKFPKIAQMNPRDGCIPVNIENVLKYYGESNYCEAKLLWFFVGWDMRPNFDKSAPILNSVLPTFEFIFKGKKDFKNSIENIIEYLKINIDNENPVLVSFEAKGGAHIRTLIEYTEKEFIFFDPGDSKLKRFNYLTNQFKNSLRADYHTLVIKPRK